MSDTRNIAAPIERRIIELIENRVPTGIGGSSCAELMDAVATQAAVSSMGGKRLRARLMLAFSALGDVDNSDPAALDIACAIEVFQTAALVHDDIIDDSDMRRGKPAAHRALASAFHRLDTLSASAGEGPRDSAVGSGLGIMLGDLLATLSVDIANGAEPDAGRARAVIAAFLNMQREVEVGQVLDLAAETIDLADPRTLADNALTVYRWKTASYTTIAPIELGLVHAGVDPREARDTAERVGTPLGLAFQLADDMLDVAGDSARTGKPVGGDIREGKRTVLLADTLMRADRDERAWLADAYRREERGARDVERVMADMESTGALAHSRVRIAALWDDASAALDAACAHLEVSRSRAQALREACAAFIPVAVRG